jgi:hypothetical protein
MRIHLGKTIVNVIAVLIFAAGAIGGVGTIYLRIRAGHGTDTFQNGYGQYLTWGSSAGLLIGIVIFLLGIYLVRLWQIWRRSRQEGISTREIEKEIKRSI